MGSTNDAYVKADYTTVAPKVSGYIAGGAGRGQSAGHGRPESWRASTIAISAPRWPRPRPTSRDAEAGIRNLDAQLALQQSVIDQANADIASAEAALDFAAAGLRALPQPR